VIHKVACIRDGVKAQKSGTDIDDIISEAEVVLRKLVQCNYWKAA
jgi:hypothetical protein